MQTNQGIQVISRAAGILRILGQDTDGLSLGQIARRVALPRSTVQRIVGALSDEGLVSTEKGSGGIRLGPEIQNLAQASFTDLRERMRSIMKSISDETGETVDLAVLDGKRMLFVDQVVGTQRLRTVSKIGEAFPLATTANGKAAMARLDEHDAAKLLIAELEDTDGPAPRLSDLLEEIAAIRQGALARDEDDHTEGVSALGFAMADQRGDVFALSVPIPSSRYHRVKELLETVLLKYRAELNA
ncbi:MAG: IclR family transcriptional regulator [Pseudomonadota bacterium]